ncbi:MAG TPA: PQQ-dependent sugar dehydrogenase [Pyrinomonadaceae bacterium]|nr:PQQ-dependent sugar dehydrogenase [Pyrinomonadaceae bacterium]
MKQISILTLALCTFVFSMHSTGQDINRAFQSDRSSLRLIPHRISLSNGRSFDLNLPEDFEITVAVQGLKRVRFMAKSPDDRIFVTDMFNLTDNKRGVVYILDQFDPVSGKFAQVTRYLTGLRNPNSIAFYKDATGIDWFYLALTDRLLRYKYTHGETAPTSQPEVLATFPAYGLDYKYGGWHLTRTIAIGNGKIYVSVGSSCNACDEKEDVRASVLEMDPDGKNQRRFATGLRNAVGIRWINGQLFATNMGSDHLGDHRPADTMLVVEEGVNYGWPYCFQVSKRMYTDPKLNPRSRKMDCRKVPPAEVAFDAHSSPLGFEYFGDDHTAALRGYFLIGLHGSTKKSLNHGYRVVRLHGDGKLSGPPEEFISGFNKTGKVNGRPVDLLSVGKDAFLLTDDYAGVIYYLRAK